MTSIDTSTLRLLEGQSVHLKGAVARNGVIIVGKNDDAYHLALERCLSSIVHVEPLPIAVGDTVTTDVKGLSERDMIYTVRAIHREYAWIALVDSHAGAPFPVRNLVRV